MAQNKGWLVAGNIADRLFEALLGLQQRKMEQQRYETDLGFRQGQDARNAEMHQRQLANLDAALLARERGEFTEDYGPGDDLSGIALEQAQKLFPGRVNTTPTMQLMPQQSSVADGPLAGQQMFVPQHGQQSEFMGTRQQVDAQRLQQQQAAAAALQQQLAGLQIDKFKTAEDEAAAQRQRDAFFAATVQSQPKMSDENMIRTAVQLNANPPEALEWLLRHRAAMTAANNTGMRLSMNAPVQLSQRIPPDLLAAAGRVTMNGSETQREAFFREINRLAEIGDMEMVKDSIRQRAVDGENVDVKNQLHSRQLTIRSIQDIRQTLNQLKAKGIDTNLLTGSVENIARRLGTSTDPDLAKLSVKLQNALVNYRRGATGVAFSARESADYERMFPNYKNTEAVNLALLEGFEDMLKVADSAYWQHKLGNLAPTILSNQHQGGGAVAANSYNGPPPRRDSNGATWGIENGQLIEVVQGPNGQWIKK